MELTAVLTPAEEGGFIALNPETGTATQGESIEEAVENLREATALLFVGVSTTEARPPRRHDVHARNTCLSCLASLVRIVEIEEAQP